MIARPPVCSSWSAYEWIPRYNIQYIMGIDGLSVTMVLLTALLCPICLLASWNIEKGVKGYFALFLLLNAGMMGVFCSLDFFLFYIFWEVMLLPMYFLIGIWGGPRREYAAIKFFLYTLFGSVLMLIAMLALYFHNDPHTFDMLVLMEESGTYSPRASSSSCLDRPVHRLRDQDSRPSRSTPGYPTPTSRRRRRSPSSSPAYCSRWAHTGSCRINFPMLPLGHAGHALSGRSPRSRHLERRLRRAVCDGPGRT